MTDLEKLQLKNEILAELKASAVSINNLPGLSTTSDLDEVIIQHNGRTHKIAIGNIPSLGGTYTDSQARAAMGDISNTNPLNHSR